MSDIEKAIFKAKLELETITPEEIQKWAIETLEKDPSNDLALDICFLSTSDQVLIYFKQLPNKVYTISSAIMSDLLKSYIEKNIDLIHNRDTLYPFLHQLLSLSKSIENEDLYELLNYYDDEFYLSFEGYSPSEPDEVFKNFISDLKSFSSKFK
ncbi:hypothetical protein WCE00_14980 [Acinetobacter haemolyticus]|uniref:hypothetical protein n=1 Tax=Acinetobacter haemolyticus TaxID=29430 RepID=UPI000F73621D|nr:hypothetical protein [Acinetobacter haemolyticus]MCU4388768.1 hypothetical protein [Acinetobacter haemolyticus]NAR48520.1 hypothetical protein [Acinetobacter haemolyticus]RSN74149.1 hypothetical protein EA769_13690 [Acinetobacter haemolyticus]